MIEVEVVAIVGSRDYLDKNTVTDAVESLNIQQQHGMDIEIVSGGAQGPDTWAVDHAAVCGLSFRVFAADWDTHGKAAGPIRNTEIVKACDRVIAFWDGKSRGTLDTIRKATRAGKHVEIIPASSDPS